jgi:hypothetical protein
MKRPCARAVDRKREEPYDGHTLIRPGVFSNQRANTTRKKDKTMKQVLLFAASAVLLATLSGCGSLRTPGSGANAEKVYYSTFFGISIESAVYGDGIIVNNK